MTPATTRTLPLVALLALFGCGATQPYYCDGYLIRRPVAQVRHAEILDEVEELLKLGKIRSLAVDTGQGAQPVYPPPPGSALPLLDMVPLPAIVAVDNAYYLRRRGGEWDQIITTDSGERLPITVIWELDGDMVVRIGAALPDSAPATLSTAEVSERQGGAKIQGVDRGWSPQQLRSLDLALSRLDPIERRLIEGISFQRRGRVDCKEKKAAGCYHGSLEQRIDLYDGAFEPDTFQFVGAVGEPLPASAGVVLHEIGHAIDDTARVRRLRALAAQVEAYKRRAEAIDRQARRGEVRARDALDALVTESERLREAMAAARGLGKRSSLVLTRYEQVRGKRKGPTVYGRTDLSQSFAEAFALYRGDPEALRRIFPEVHAWFAAGGHIQAVKDECGAACQPLFEVAERPRQSSPWVAVPSGPPQETPSGPTGAQTPGGAAGADASSGWSAPGTSGGWSAPGASGGWSAPGGQGGSEPPAP